MKTRVVYIDNSTCELRREDYPLRHLPYVLALFRINHSGEDVFVLRLEALA